MESLCRGWEKPEFCKIYNHRLKMVAKELAIQEYVTPSWREPIFPDNDDETFIEFLGVTNSINFCFTDPETGQKFDTEYPDGSGIIYTGSSAMTACIKRALDNGVPILSPGYLSKLNRRDADMIFIKHKNPIPMINMRISNLRSTGETLMDDNQPNSFAGIFKKAEYLLFNNGDGIIERIISRFVSFHDQSIYNEHRLFFYKRAQLLPLIYHGRAIDSLGKLPLIRDPEYFGAITDYAVPNALRALGILKYNKLISQMIDSGQKIIAESKVEVEIRAVSACIMLRLLELINRYRSKIQKKLITMVELDYRIWQAGRATGAKYKHHLTYTTAY